MPSEMPTELSKLIQEFARPRSRTDWKKGSYMRRTTGYAEFYWEMCEGAWYDFDHPNPDVMIAFYYYGWINYRLSGANLLLGLSQRVDASFLLIRTMFDRMTTEENLPFLAADVYYYDDSISIAGDRKELFCWFFL